MRKKSKIIVGIDDATKCPCIGSIFVCGAVADEKTILKWKKLGVKDSKLITAKKREKLAKIIKQTALAFSIKQIEPAKIDDKSLNLNDWEMITVFEVMRDLLKKTDFEDVYLDNWEVNSQRFKKRFEFLTQTKYAADFLKRKFHLNPAQFDDLNIIAEHRADEKYTIVGAASILAKTESDRQYRNYKKKYGDFGSGSPADPRTRKFVWIHRKNPLPIIRKSWNTYRVLSKLQKLEDDLIYSRNKDKKRYGK
jgi:ribonuclease HII